MVAAKYDELKKLGVEVLAISVDSPFVHKMWQENELSKMVPGGVPFPILSDSGGNIGKAYGVYDEESGIDVRGRFIINLEGIIVAMEILTPPVGRNFAELIRQIQAFQHVYNTKGAEVCPAGWRPGRPTLKPGPDLVGKVWEVWKVENAE
ncbi:MAG: Alkyl hydroperoxide reductase subunit AhpC [Thermodesulfobacterium sp.]|uniref:Alkyl hydroperoxide reductase C n=1 Tax=Candidatus Thermodesulfobacterium syntrophicum TaxID=3060442 RepID=A0AAE3P503_9BACT|nr:Alkyl hydroperoxide reductase subunit AhpC [Candidatus Thermodesulfobacterium syntrophicum]